MNTKTDTARLRQLDQAHHLHPFTNLRNYSEEGGRIVSRAEHVYIYDSDGNKMLDGMSGLWCCNLGYSQSKIKEAIFLQLQELPFYNNFFRCSNEPAVELARALVDVTPSPVQPCIFYQLRLGGERHQSTPGSTLLRPTGKARENLSSSAARTRITARPSLPHHSLRRNGCDAQADAGPRLTSITSTNRYWFAGGRRRTAQ